MVEAKKIKFIKVGSKDNTADLMTWISQTCDPFQRITHSALERDYRNG